MKESIKNGLPIIPFASPTFYGNSKKSDSLVKEDQLQPPSLSECCEADDDIFLMDHDHEEESLPSLNSIVRRAKHEVDNLEDNSVTRKQSQSLSRGSQGLGLINALYGGNNASKGGGAS